MNYHMIIVWYGLISILEIMIIELKLEHPEPKKQQKNCSINDIIIWFIICDLELGYNGLFFSTEGVGVGNEVQSIKTSK